ncbi:PadR family transcriptional regulator [Lacibacterium aquatile]|uniref:PadR family transcriptional regulator n=1 Tax=Lacibacterium aquatile TaxID=1168082 RepID=A0ABW5DL44_9PROT
MRFGHHTNAESRESCRERRFSRLTHWLEEHHRRHHERGGRGRGRGRLFEHGDLRLLVLHLLAAQPRSGYEIIKTIEETVGGLYSPSPGVVYPTLTLLEEQGLIVQTASEGAKKTFAVTPEGEAALQAGRATVVAILERMEHLGATEGREPPAAVQRAMENVKTALRLKFARGTLTSAQADAIAAALDQAALTIEKA